MKEADHQKRLVQLLDYRNIAFSAPAQSTYTRSIKQMRNNYAMGVRRGLPDLFVWIAPHQSIDGRAHLVPIEMKKAKGKRGGKNGSELTDDQAQWVWRMREAGVNAYVAHGFDEAVRILDKYLKRKSRDFLDSRPF